jgi:hypothetical protein
MLGTVRDLEGRQCDPRDPQPSGKAMYVGLFEKIIVRYRRQDLPLGPSDMFSKTRYYSDTVPFGGGRACIFMSVWWRGGYGRINGGLRVLDCWSSRRKAGIHR